jgi:myo-inositol-1(or 4)-monophosphatase
MPGSRQLDSDADGANERTTELTMARIDFLETAIAAAKIAGVVHLRYFRAKVKTRTKSVSYDLVTTADTESEKAIVTYIRRYFPDHNFLGEEGVYARTASEYTWIIDPLDGTNNFASGMPIFCASVAVANREGIVAGAVYDATRDELFYAARGRGAFLNGKRMRVNTITDFARSVLIMGFYYSRGPEMDAAFETIKRFMRKKVLGVRRLGAAALDLCYVADGRAAGFWEHQLSPWDYAAGKLIVEEAGGMVTGSRGEAVPIGQKYFIVASNSHIHKQMLRIIQQKSS